MGIDIAEPAIADARINAVRNGFSHDETADDAGFATTTRFVASAAEKVLPDVMRDISSGGARGAKPVVIAVVDPARDGLHGIVVRTLRANEWIQRLIYVSCNPVGTLTRDAAMLCGPPTKKYPGRPFKPMRSQPVDMFPMTKHCEMVMTFDRMSRRNMRDIRRESREGEERHLGWVVEEKKRNVVVSRWSPPWDRLSLGPHHSPARPF